MIAGGVESMTRAPFVMGKADTRVLAHGEDRGHDHRLALRQSADEERSTASTRCPRLPRTWRRTSTSSRADQDAFALRSQERAAAAIAAGRLAEEIVPVTIPAKKGDPVVFKQDEHPRATTLEALAQAEGRREARRHGHRRQRVRRQRRRVRGAARVGGSGEALRPEAARAHGRGGDGRRARRASWASGPRPRRARCWPRPDLTIGDMNVIELNEAFAAQALAVTRDLGLAGRRRARQSQRRRDRARPSARRERRAARHHRAVSARAHRRPLRACARCASASARASRLIIERV